jgi:hypothetical protein
MIGDQRASKAQLRVSETHKRGPAIGLFGMTHPWQCPVEELFDKTKGMFELEATHIGAPHLS